MTKSLINYLLLALFLVGFAACKKDDVDVSQINNIPFTLAKVDPGTTVNETSQVVTVNFELDADQIVATRVLVEVDPTRTTATNHEDYNFEPVEVEVQNYLQTGSFQYEILEDRIPEGDETITFVLSGVQSPFGATNTLEYVVTIKDENLTITFDWGGEVAVDTFADDKCNLVDFDIYTLDAYQGADLGIYKAATGACPETYHIQVGELDDGDYFFGSNLYASAMDGTTLGVDFPITVTAGKGGAISGTYTTQGAEVWNSDEPDYANSGAFSFKDVAKLTISGSSYTLTAPDGSTIMQGATGKPQTK